MQNQNYAKPACLLDRLSVKFDEETVTSQQIPTSQFDEFGSSTILKINSMTFG
jgi:hypothetical protein